MALAIKKGEFKYPWMSLEKAIESQKNNPKNILVDVYTNLQFLSC